MSARLSISQPLLFVSLFALLLMGVLFYMQRQSDRSIRDMQAGNETATSTFKANNSLQEIINGFTIIETALRKQSQANYTILDKEIRDTMALIKKELDNIKTIAGTSPYITQLNSLSASKFDLYNNILGSRATNEKIKLLLNSSTNNDLNDNIYIAAQNIQIHLENNLQNTIEKNTQVSAKVLRLGRSLTISALTAILLLGTLIIRHLKRNIRLLNELETEKVKTLEAANIKEQFLANMSHEIRTPVNAITGFTNLLQKTKLDNNQSEYVSLIKTACNNLYEIVNDILDISKIEAGMLSLNKQTFSLKELFYEIEMLFTQMAKAKNLQFSCIISKAVPDYVIGDSERIKQVFINLISNAIKFTSNGSVSVNVSQLSNDGNNSVLCFKVKDTGLGIAQDKLQTIFERFVQANTEPARHFGGTGLGLSIVKNLVEMHNGNIQVQSKEGQGTEFTVIISFPLGDSDEKNSTEFNKGYNHTERPEIKFSSQSKVLAAEDNPVNQLLIKYLFQQWNIAIDIVKNGIEAITSLHQKNYDLILMDIQMPEMNGFEAVNQIRNIMKLNTPIVAMTAHTLPGEKEKCLTAGMNDYLPKPIIEKELIDILNKWLPENKTVTGYINKNELNSLFDNNAVFVSNILHAFKEQFPKDVYELEAAVTNEEYKKARSIAHRMKTTVTSINSKSPLTDSILVIEEASDNEFNNEKIRNAVATVTGSCYSVLEEVDRELEKLS